MSKLKSEDFTAEQSAWDPYQSPAVKAMLRAAAICENYYADEVWTNTLARGAAFSLCRALRDEATKIAIEEMELPPPATNSGA